MKTLDQLAAKADQAQSKLDLIEAKTEKRIPLDAANTPGDDNFHFIITKPGSYLLTGNLDVSKPNGISVRAAGVTLDLNGFEIRREPSGGGNGIDIADTNNRAVVRNGSLRGFSIAVADNNFGIHLSQLSVSNCSSRGLSVGAGAVVEKCRVTDSSGDYGILVSADATVTDCVVTIGDFQFAGISAGPSCVVERCVAVNNLTAIGIYAGIGSVVSHSTANFNTGVTPLTGGIETAADSTVSDCTAIGNTSTSSPSHSAGRGITVGAGSAVRNCNVSDNRGSGIQTFERCRVIDCKADGNGAAETGSDTGSGISAGIRAIITGCAADKNGNDGISVGGDSVVIGNHASFNGRSGAAAGIRTSPSGSRIEGNHTRDNNGTGILAGTLDVIVRNTAGNNVTGVTATNFNPSSGANFAPIQTPSTATNPLANIVF
jgi:hypothetical protein